MYLSDEYFQRHKIKNVARARYCKEGYVLFKKKDAKSSIQNWKVLRVLWTAQSRHPGAYDIEFLQPTHDGYRYAIYFQSGLKQFFRWDEYEKNFLDILNQMKGYDVVLEPKDVFFSFWKIFVFVFDSWFSDQPLETQNWLFSTIDPDLSLDDRYRNLEKFLRFLETKHAWVYNHWYNNILKCIDNYAFWITELKSFYHEN